MKNIILAASAVGFVAALASAQTFNSAGGFVIPAAGTALAYGAGNAEIVVTGVTGATSVTVTITDFAHSFADDTAALLVAPNGTTILLWDGPGGGTAGTSFTWTFDDTAAATLPNGNPLSSGTFLAGQNQYSDVFDAPAPAGPYGTSLAAALAGAGPNGSWQLFVQDFVSGDEGAIASWSITFVPTPGAAAMLGLGGLAAFRRRRA